MKRWSLIIIGLLLIAAAGIWKFGISQRWTNRYQDGWSWTVNTLGQTGYPDEETGMYAEGTTLADDPINLSIRTVTAETDGAPTGDVIINDHYETRDTATDEITWEFTATATVDMATGRHAEGDYAGDYYFFPRNVDKDTTYTVTNTSYFSLPMAFDREENVAGINTYVFKYSDAINDTLANEAFVDLEPGQEVFCYDFSLEYWVEPATGEIVKYREWCEGDWVTDTQSGERLYPISRWGGETSGDDIIRQVTNVQNKLATYRWASLYAPLAALIAGIAVAGFGATRPSSNSKEKEA